MPATSCSLSNHSTKGQNVHETERMLSVAAGAALFLWGLDRRPLGALAGFALGGGLIYRGLTGHCGMYQAMGVSTAEIGDGERSSERGVAAKRDRIEMQLTIAAPPKQIYESWRNLRNLPSVLKHVTSVTELSEKQSHWTLKTPLGVTLKWDAEIIQDEPGRIIAWESLPGGAMSTAGSVRFDESAGGKETRLTLNMKYDPPGGKVGIWVVQALGTDLRGELENDLQAFKQRMERVKTVTRTS